MFIHLSHLIFNFIIIIIIRDMLLQFSTIKIKFETIHQMTFSISLVIFKYRIFYRPNSLFGHLGIYVEYLFKFPWSAIDCWYIVSLAVNYFLILFSLKIVNNRYFSTHHTCAISIFHRNSIS